MGNPNEHGGYYFVDYKFKPGSRTYDREKGSFRHYIHYFLKGSVVYYTETGPFEAQAGQLIYLPMNIHYTARMQDAHILSCGFTHFPEAAEHPFLPQKLPDQFIESFLEIPKDITPNSETLGKFYILLSQLLPYLKQSSEPYLGTITEKIRLFIWRNYKCQVRDIADYCKMSVPNLYRVLKQNGYRTPNQLKQEVLIQKAINLLENTTATVERISEGLGFSSTNYFRKVFKEYTGTSPRQYRKNAAIR